MILWRCVQNIITMKRMEWMLCTNEISQDFGLRRVSGGYLKWQQPPGPWFNIKMPSYQYRKSHCGDKTILRPSYLHNGISYPGKMTSLYWIRALVPGLLVCVTKQQIAISQKKLLWRHLWDFLWSTDHVPMFLFVAYILWPLLLTWFNFNPSMDK